MVSTITIIVIITTIMITIILGGDNRCHWSLHFIIGWTYCLIWSTSDKCTYWFETVQPFGWMLFILRHFVQLLIICLNHAMLCWLKVITAFAVNFEMFFPFEAHFFFTCFHIPSSENSTSPSGEAHCLDESSYKEIQSR